LALKTGFNRLYFLIVFGIYYVLLYWRIKADFLKGCTQN